MIHVNSTSEKNDQLGWTKKQIFSNDSGKRENKKRKEKNGDNTNKFKYQYDLHILLV